MLHQKIVESPFKLKYGNFIGGGKAGGDLPVVQLQRHARRSGGAQHDVVAIDGKQRRGRAGLGRHQNKTRAGKGAAKQVELDARGRVAHRLRQDRQRRLVDILTAGRHVERAGKLAAMIADRRAGATQIGIAAEEMLVADDGDGAVVGQRRADAVGADAGLGPDRAGPQAEIVKMLVVAGRSAPLQRDAVAIGEQQAEAGLADRQEQPVEFTRRLGDQPPGTLGGETEFRLADPQRQPLFLRRQPVHGHAAPPRSHDRGTRHGGLRGRINLIGMRKLSAHWLLHQDRRNCDEKSCRRNPKTAPCVIKAEFLWNSYISVLPALSNPYGSPPHIGPRSRGPRGRCPSGLALSKARLHRSSTGVTTHDGYSSSRRGGGVLPALPCLYARLRQALRGTSMTFDYVLSGAVTVLIALYLTYALLRPERF